LVDIFTAQHLSQEDEEEAKKVQNRYVSRLQHAPFNLTNLYFGCYSAAQRAFRERKQSQFAELQARIEQYERGEIERNVALQAAAKRLKEENDALKKENDELRRSIETFNCPSCSSERNHLKRSAGDDVDDAGNKDRRGRPTRVNPSKRMRSARGELLVIFNFNTNKFRRRSAEHCFLRCFS